MSTPINRSTYSLENIPHSENRYTKVRKQSSAVYDALETFPSSPVKKIKKKLAFCQKVSDPRPIFYDACQMLQTVKKYNGNTLLHEAVLSSSKSMCKLFLDQSSRGIQGSKDSQNNQGETPLYTALRVNSLDLFKLILKYKPNLLLCNEEFVTICELAAQLNRVEFVKALLDHTQSLDSLVPPESLQAFLKALWATRNAQLVAIVAPRYMAQVLTLPQNDVGLVYNLKRESMRALAGWIRTPFANPRDLSFALTSKIWDNLLYHFIGKKAFLFSKDRKYVRRGSLEYKMYIPVLWAWRIFCLSPQMQKQQNPLFKKIDTAIARSIGSQKFEALVRIIKKGEKPVILPAGWKTHSLTVVFFSDYLFICNRGKNIALQKYNITALRFNKSAISVSLLSKITAFTEEKRAAIDGFLFKAFLESLDTSEDAFCKAIHSKWQPSDQSNENCVVANMRTAICAILFTSAEKTTEGWDFDTPFALYKGFAISSRFSILNEYLQGQKALLNK